MRLQRASFRAARGRNRRLLTVAAAVAAAFTLALPSAQAAPAPAGPGAAALSAVNDAVKSSDVSGIAWYTDQKAGKVVVTADSSVSRAEIAQIKKSAGADAVQIKRTDGTFRPLLSAGAAIYGGQYRCSLGFNVTKGGAYYFLTAGHCGEVAGTWYTDSGHNTLIGDTQGYTFPGSDYALVRYDNTGLSHPGGYTAANAYVGESVKRTGSTTGTHGGTVTALDVTVRYSGGGGTVYGLIQTNVCAEPGDSGGPMYDGSKALGLTSGGSGDCSSGGTTFFQPVPAAASHFGVTVY